MNLTKLLSASLLIAATLTSTTLTGPQKLDRLTDNYGQVIEIGDDAVGLLPGAIGSIALMIVDNPPVDSWQREMIAKPMAEATVQVYNAMTGAIESLSDFAKGVIKPALALINALSSDTALSNEERSAALKKLMLELLMAFTSGDASLLPAGFKNLFDLLKGVVENALDAVAAFVSEALYQVWKALHPEQRVLALA